PETVLIGKNGVVECLTHSQDLKIPSEITFNSENVSNVRSQIDRSEYISTVKKLKNHIQLGDIYEVNYCVEHAIEDVAISPFRLFEEMQQISPAPFSCFVADNGRFLLSSSPERFMKKEGVRLISQPMKGTNRRLSDNESQIKALQNDSKEVSENVMITDLVRNDLSKSAVRGTVKVDELCRVYEFKHVNQMISTVSAELREDVHPLDAILNAFPMGSMTGAPKIRAMELIDQYEDFSRGLYSGAVGYFTPELDFDFNVVIRSILYNKEKKIATFPTGGAITINSDPEKEYEECMLKAEAMRKVLMNHGK
ncbi:MAG: anthranilate synthase component I family protein, partial [Flavobacteriales bacterium]|nr:anthranilate synthase component I family protein [Flavobacteriales bacterium]